jgi:cell division protein FtsB
MEFREELMAPTRAKPRTTRPNGPYLRGGPPTGRRIRRPALWLGGAAVVVLLAVALLGENGLRTYLGLRGERLELEAEVERLRAHRAELEAGVAALDEETGDLEALERVARERYRMRKPGETVIEVVGEDELDAEAEQDD